MKPPVTIILPNYQTPELTKLCVRSLHKFTPANAFHLLAVDNASGDESLEYLRSLPQIRLIERKKEDIAGMPPALMHTTAMDLALKMVDTPFVLSFHTDTIVTRPDWLDFLLKRIQRKETIAGTGSWKLELVPPLKRIAKKMEDSVRHLLGKGRTEVRFLRSHCALYRTDLVHRYTNGFGGGICAGSSTHELLTKAGFEMDFIPPELLIRYMVHLNHATMILHPESGSRKTAHPRALQSLQKRMNAFRAILDDSSLDFRKEEAGK